MKRSLIAATLTLVTSVAFGQQQPQQKLDADAVLKYYDQTLAAANRSLAMANGMLESLMAENKQLKAAAEACKPKAEEKK